MVSAWNMLSSSDHPGPAGLGGVMPQVQDGRDRTLIQEYQLNGGANQQWDLVPLNDGNVEVVNAYSGKLRTPRRSLACAVDDETDGNGKEKSCRQPAPTRSGFRVRWGRDRRLKDRCRRSILLELAGNRVAIRSPSILPP